MRCALWVIYITVVKNCSQFLLGLAVNKNSINTINIIVDHQEKLLVQLSVSSLHNSASFKYSGFDWVIWLILIKRGNTSHLLKIISIFYLR